MCACVCVFIVTMASGPRELQWRKLVRACCLRGRVTWYVAAGAVACGGLWLLLGDAAAADHAAWCHCCIVLLPSFLRCVQLGHVHGLPGQETLLLEFAQRVPYYCVGMEDYVDIAVPGWASCKTVSIAHVDSIASCSFWLHILLRSSCRGRRSTLANFIVISRGRRRTLDVSCCVLLRIALSGLRQVATSCKLRGGRSIL